MDLYRWMGWSFPTQLGGVFPPKSCRSIVDFSGLGGVFPPKTLPLQALLALLQERLADGLHVKFFKVQHRITMVLAMLALDLDVAGRLQRIDGVQNGFFVESCQPAEPISARVYLVAVVATVEVVGQPENHTPGSTLQ